MLAARLVTGLSLIAMFLAALVVDERFAAPLYPLWMLISLLVLGQTAAELVGLLDRTSARPSGNTVVGGVLALGVANWAPHVQAYLARSSAAGGMAVPYDPAAAAEVFSWPLWTFIAVLMFAFVAQSLQFQRPGRTMATIAGTVLAVAYVGLLGSFVIQFRWLGQSRAGAVGVLALVATAKGADTGAYTLGRIAGRHKLWPRLSPNKTVEGAVGGLVFGLAAALIVLGLSRQFQGWACLTWPETIGFGLIVASAAQLGDLMESMIKRDCESKDASAALPGFGGMLDVMDSLLFAAPVAYGYWLCFAC